MMKKVLTAVIIMIGVIGATHFEHNYTRNNCVVTDKNDCILELTDRCGYTWVWLAEEQHEIELYQSVEIGDELDIKMHDNFSSAYIDDDVIKELIKK